MQGVVRQDMREHVGPIDCPLGNGYKKEGAGRAIPAGRQRTGMRSGGQGGQRLWDWAYKDDATYSEYHIGTLMATSSNPRIRMVDMVYCCHDDTSRVSFVSHYGNIATLATADNSRVEETENMDESTNIISPALELFVSDTQRLVELQALRDRAVGDGILSEDEAIALLEPEVTLLVNEREESQVAFAALEQAHISFRVVPSFNSQRPHALWGDTTFDGIEEIRALAETLQEIDDQLESSIEKQEQTLFAKRDSRLSQWMEDVYFQRLEDAREVMARIRELR